MLLRVCVRSTLSTAAMGSVVEQWLTTFAIFPQSGVKRLVSISVKEVFRYEFELNFLPKFFCSLLAYININSLYFFHYSIRCPSN